MKNSTKKHYKLETIFIALIITNVINHVVKKVGLPILVALLSVFFFHNVKEKISTLQPDHSNIENVAREMP